MLYKLDNTVLQEYFIEKTEKVKRKFNIMKIDWNLIGMVIICLCIGDFVKSYNPQIKEYISMSLELYWCVPLLFLANFIMGSSGKYIGLVSMLCLLLGPQYFVGLFAIAYVAYYLSPTHKCNPINIKYFNVNIIEYYKYLIYFTIPILIYGILNIII